MHEDYSYFHSLLGMLGENFKSHKAHVDSIEHFKDTTITRMANLVSNTHVKIPFVSAKKSNRTKTIGSWVVGILIGTLFIALMCTITWKSVTRMLGCFRHCNWCHRKPRATTRKTQQRLNNRSDKIQEET